MKDAKRRQDLVNSLIKKTDKERWQKGEPLLTEQEKKNLRMFYSIVDRVTLIDSGEII